MVDIYGKLPSDFNSFETYNWINSPKIGVNIKKYLKPPPSKCREKDTIHALYGIFIYYIYKSDSPLPHPGCVAVLSAGMTLQFVVGNPNPNLYLPKEYGAWVRSKVYTVYIYIYGTQMTSIFVGQPPQNKA